MTKKLVLIPHSYKTKIMQMEKMKKVQVISNIENGKLSVPIGLYYLIWRPKVVNSTIDTLMPNTGANL